MLLATPKTLLFCSTTALAYLISPSVFAGKTSRISVSSSGTQANDQSSYTPSISADGRFVTFASDASNLVAGDSNAASDVFVSDLLTKKVTRVSASSSGVIGNGASFSPTVSADGRYITYSSNASNLVADDTNELTDVFVHDRNTRQTTRVSLSTEGQQGNDNSGWHNPGISPDGRYVVFDSDASNLVAGDNNDTPDVFVHDRLTKQTTRVSATADTEGNDVNGWNSPGISADGRYVVFDSDSPNLVENDTNEMTDIFIHDRNTRAISRVSLASDGTQGSSLSWQPSISANGRYVAFESSADNLVAGDTNEFSDIFVYDRSTKRTTRVSQLPNGTQGNQDSLDSHISADGRFVVFRSYASNLAKNDTNASSDIFIHDRNTKQVTRVSVDTKNLQGNRESGKPVTNADGRYVAFVSDATNLATGDSNEASDVFVRDHQLNTGLKADLKILAKQKPATLKVNATGTYSYTITNAGPNPVDDVSLILTASNGRLASIKPSQGSCGLYTFEAICHLGKLLSGKSLAVTLTAIASATPMQQQLTVSGAPVDAVPANNVSSVSTPVKP